MEGGDFLVGGVDKFAIPADQGVGLVDWLMFQGIKL